MFFGINFKDLFNNFIFNRIGFLGLCPKTKIHPMPKCTLVPMGLRSLGTFNPTNLPVHF